MIITEPTVRCVIYIYSFPTTTSRTQEHGGGGLGQPPADAIEAERGARRPRWRGRSAPGACGEALSLESEVGCVGSHARNLRDCRPDQVASSGQIFGILSKAENLQRAFAGGGKGLARAAARPALATKSRSIEELADVRSELVVSVRVVIQPMVPLGF